MKKTVFFMLVLLLIGSVSAHHSIKYDLVEDKALVVISFEEIGDLELRLPHDARLFESTSIYNVEEFLDYKLLRVSGVGNFTFSYITESVIDHSSKSFYFILKNPFEEHAGDLYVHLPQGGILEENALLFPDPDAITTDGIQIILNWENLTSDEVVFSYSVMEDTNNIFWHVFFFLVIVFLIFYLYQSRTFKRKIKKLKSKQKIERKKGAAKAKKNITRNLFGEEKKIIEYLLGKKGHASWTKEIVKDLGISKVRLSRRLRNLVQKELIRKIPYGNENRITLLKTR